MTSTVTDPAPEEPSWNKAILVLVPNHADGTMNFGMPLYHVRSTFEDKARYVEGDQMPLKLEAVDPDDWERCEYDPAELKPGHRYPACMTWKAGMRLYPLGKGEAAVFVTEEVQYVVRCKGSLSGEAGEEVGHGYCLSNRHVFKEANLEHRVASYRQDITCTKIETLVQCWRRFELQEIGGA